MRLDREHDSSRCHNRRPLSTREPRLFFVFRMQNAFAHTSQPQPHSTYGHTEPASLSPSEKRLHRVQSPQARTIHIYVDRCHSSDIDVNAAPGG